MTLDQKLKEIEKKAIDDMESEPVVQLLAALRLAIEQRDSYITTHYINSKSVECVNESAANNIALLKALEGEK